MCLRVKNQLIRYQLSLSKIFQRLSKESVLPMTCNSRHIPVSGLNISLGFLSSAGLCTFWNFVCSSLSSSLHKNFLKFFFMSVMVLSLVSWSLMTKLLSPEVVSMCASTFQYTILTAHSHWHCLSNANHLLMQPESHQGTWSTEQSFLESDDTAFSSNYSDWDKDHCGCSSPVWSSPSFLDEVKLVPNVQLRGLKTSIWWK